MQSCNPRVFTSNINDKLQLDKEIALKIHLQANLILQYPEMKFYCVSKMLFLDIVE